MLTLLSREKGITTLRIYQYWKFHNTVIETCLRCKIPQNPRNYDASQGINPPIFFYCSEVFFSWYPNFNLLSIPYIIHPLALISKPFCYDIKHFWKTIVYHLLKENRDVRKLYKLANFVREGKLIQIQDSRLWNNQ